MFNAVNNRKYEVFKTFGQKIETLLNQSMKSGHHEVEFNAANLSSGIYLYRIESSEFQDVKKMILINECESKIGDSRKSCPLSYVYILDSQLTLLH